MKYGAVRKLCQLDDAYHVYLCYGVQIKFLCTHDVSQIAQRIALWDHHTTLWARLRAVLTKSADEWTGKFEKL